MDILSIPGYIQAVRKERMVRDASFLDITESIGPFELRPLSLHHFLVLRLTGNPLLYDEVPSPDELAFFLWLLSPGYAPGHPPARARFLKRCRKLFFPPRYLALLNTKSARQRYERKAQTRLEIAARLIDKARAFVKESLQDRPAAKTGHAYDPEYFSDPAFFCGWFASKFGWTEQHILHLPMKRLYQYVNIIKHMDGSKTPMCNPSDSVRAAYLRNLNAKVQPQNPNGN